MRTDKKLNPCPWCGGDVYLDWNIGDTLFTHEIKCPEHGVMMICHVPVEASLRERADREKELVNDWNTTDWGKIYSDSGETL